MVHTKRKRGSTFVKKSIVGYFNFRFLGGFLGGFWVGFWVDTYYLFTPTFANFNLLPTSPRVTFLYSFRVIRSR